MEPDPKPNILAFAEQGAAGTNRTAVKLEKTNVIANNVDTFVLTRSVNLKDNGGNCTGLHISGTLVANNVTSSLGPTVDVQAWDQFDKAFGNPFFKKPKKKAGTVPS